ncbi:hypothetical protein C8J56DRAFT_1083049 [Mycena floridula]|nr:hypothetical protein C8J56DRAFT_1083049 [Mycena floridula]
MVMVQLSFLFRFIFLVSPTFASMTMEVPPVIKTDEIFTVSWTRAATDPAKFTVNILEGNGTPFLGGLSVTTTNVSGTFSVPAWAGVPPGVYFVEAVDSSNPSDVLGSSNKFTLLSASPTSSAPVDSPQDVSEQWSNFYIRQAWVNPFNLVIYYRPCSSTIIHFNFQLKDKLDNLCDVLGISVAVRIHIIKPALRWVQVADNHWLRGSITGRLVILDTSPMVSESPVSPFTDSEPASIPWIHGKVRQPFTISNGLRTSNTKTGNTHHSRDLGETASGTLVEAPDPSHRDNSDGSEEVPLHAAVEIERLRLENRILRRRIDGSSPVGETLPPSYPGSRSSSSNDHE